MSVFFIVLKFYFFITNTINIYIYKKTYIMWETEQFWGTIDYHSIFLSAPKTVWLQTFFRISSFVFRKKNINTGLEMLEGE